MTYDRGVGSGGRLERAFLLTGVALISSAGLLLEIALTRVFSVLFFYHYVFAILSIAVLGIGLGAAVVHQRGVPKAVFPWLHRLTLLAGFAILGLTLLTVTTVPVDGRLVLALVAALPYVLVGMVLATIFAAWPEKSPTLYWADMGGAGLGAAAVIPALNWFGGLDVLLLAAALFAASSICFHLAGRPSRSWKLCRSIILSLLLLVSVGLAFGRLDVDVERLATPKPLTRQLEDPQARIVYTHQDSFARTDVLESDADPWHKQVFINGAAGSLMPRHPTNAEEESRFTRDIGYFPFCQTQERACLEQGRRVFVVGPGGGRDVLFALLSGSRSITAVEVSPGVVEAVRRFGDYNGNLFDHPAVSVAVDEGRSYLRRSGEQFDLISLSEVIALTAERGSYVLTENYVYTVEAFHDYLDHLAPGGRLALRLYDELTLTRAFTTIVAALRERGLGEAEATRRVVVLLDPTLVSREAPFRSPLLILYRDPVTPEMAAQLLDSIRQAGFIPLFVPHVHEQPPLAGLTTGEATLDSLVADFSRADVSPTSDERPFFYEFRPGLPDLLRQLLTALALVTALSLAYLWRRRRTIQRAVLSAASLTIEGPFWPLVLYFALLGAGFMLMELVVIQRLTRLLGHPTTALSVSLFAILVSGGLGSLVGGRLARDRSRRTAVVTGASVVAGLLGLAYVSLVPALTERLLALPPVVSTVTAVGLISPLFFALGIPFPLGLQMAEELSGPPMVPLAWAINGLASVGGSVGGVAIAISWSFDGVLAIASLAYWTVALLTVSFRRAPG